MANGYQLIPVKQPSGATAIGAGVTNQVVSKLIRRTAADSRAMNVVIETTAVTSTTGITAKVQERLAENESGEAAGDNWVDVTGASATITAAGFAVIRWDSSTVSNARPTMPICRVVVSTGTGDAVTVEQVLITERI